MEFDEVLAIVSLTGTFSVHGSHLDLSIPDGHFDTRCIVYTTAEIVVEVCDNVLFKREFSVDWGYEERAVHER